MNFSRLTRSSFLGRIARLPLRLLPGSAVIPILQGPARGLKWSVGSSNHGCWLGSYEYEKQARLTALIKPGAKVFDIGANVGYYTLAFARLVGSAGRVIAFEPLPSNLEHLRNHVERNHLDNVQIIAAAVTNKPGEVRFAAASSNAMGRISAEGDLIVQGVAIDRLIGDGMVPIPDILKIDVEGAEEDVLAGSAELIAHRTATFLIATHSSALRDKCRMTMTNAGYRVTQIGGDPDELLAVPG